MHVKHKTACMQNDMTSICKKVKTSNKEINICCFVELIETSACAHNYGPIFLNF